MTLINLIEELARLGNFSYTIVSMGNGGNTKDFAKLARVMLGLDDPDVLPDYNAGAVPGGPVDVLGQGDWLHDASRQDWAIWTFPVLTSDVLLLTKPPVYLPSTPSGSMLTDPFTSQVWWRLLGLAAIASVLFWFTAHSHAGSKAEVPPIAVIYTTFGQPCGLGVR